MTITATIRTDQSRSKVKTVIIAFTKINKEKKKIAMLQAGVLWKSKHSYTLLGGLSLPHLSEDITHLFTLPLGPQVGSQLQERMFV
jgi:hypothetical protein